MDAGDLTHLERLEALAREVEEVATRIAVHAKAFGPGIGTRRRLGAVTQHLRVALDELGGFPYAAEDITEE